MLGNGFRDRFGSSRGHHSAAFFAQITKMATRVYETSSWPSWRHEAWNHILLSCEDLRGGLGGASPPEPCAGVWGAAGTPAGT